MDLFRRKLIIRTFIKMQPTGKQRARTGKQGFFYTPKKTTQAAEWVRLNVQSILQAEGYTPDPNGVYKIKLVFYFHPPKYARTKKKNKELFKKLEESRQSIWAWCKPDNDNLEKLVWDALNELVFVDDSVIAWNETKKIYLKNPEKSEGVLVKIWKIGERLWNRK